MKKNALIALLITALHVKFSLANIYGHNAGGSMGARHGSMTSSAVKPIMQTNLLGANNLDRDQTIAVSQNKVLATALAQNTASRLPKDVARNVLGASQGCSSSGFEGTVEMASDQWKLDCLRKAKNKQEKIEKYAKMIEESPKEGECIKKLDPNTMVCQARDVMKRIVEDPYYEIDLYGNVVELIEGDKVKMMGIVENMNYDVSKKTKLQKSPMKAPRSVLEFNQLGGLIRQKGEIPKPTKANPCSSCLEALAKKESVEGQNEGCSGCDSLVDITTIKSGSFRDVSNNGDKNHKRVLDKRQSGYDEDD